MPISQKIAERLKKEISQSSIIRLPSFKTLAEDFNVSITTIGQAIQILKEEGLISISKGRNAEIVSRLKKRDTKSKKTSSEIIADKIEEEIKSGELRAHSNLQKINFYAKKFNVSTATVTQALKFLNEKAIIYKNGKYWVVGKEKSISNSPSGKNHLPTLLIIQTEIRPWSRFRTERTYRFMDNFLNEAHLANINIIACLAKANPDASKPIYKKTNLPNYEEILKAKDYLVIGALLVGDKTYYQNLEKVLNDFKNRKLPLVMFNSDDISFPIDSKNKWISKVAYKEDMISINTLSYLNQMGHNKIGLVSWHEGHPVKRERWESWETKRILSFNSAATNLRNVVIFNRTDTQIFKFTNNTKQIKKIVYKLEKSTNSRIKKTLGFIKKHLKPTINEYQGISEILSKIRPKPLEKGNIRFIDKIKHLLKSESSKKAFQNSSFILPYLLEPSISCLLFSNDRLAKNIWPLLHRIGIKYPQEISIISIDNYMDVDLLPITTVDVGISKVGYDAFHAIAKDIPFQRNSNTGEISARPSIIQRGSVKRI